MTEMQKPQTNAGASDNIGNIDIRLITQIFKSQKNKRLIYKPDQPNPDGSKNIIWEDKEIEWEKHISGELLQGGNPAADGAAVYAVVDVDRSKKTGSIFKDPKAREKDLTEQEQICRDAWNIDNKIVVFRSPSGAYHCYKFYHEPTPLNQVNKDIKKIERILIKKFKYNVDTPKTLPAANGSQIGINLPWTRGRIAYAPTGLPLTFNQFVHRYRFHHYPLLAAAAGMHDPGRHDALIRIAAILEKNNKMEFLDDVIENFGTEFTDTNYVKRIKEKKIHEKYKNISAKGISAAITNIVGFDYELPAADEPTQSIKLYRMLDPQYKPTRRSFVMEGYLKKNCLTLIAGEPGCGKTQWLTQMAYCFAGGHTFFGKKVTEPGNALIITAEEEHNEMELRVRAIDQAYGGIKNGNIIDVICYDTDFKLVKFSKDGHEKTKQFVELEQLIIEHKYKFIGLDPLISLQAGAFDENNNPQMDAFCKTYLMPLAQRHGASTAVNHHTNKLSMITEGGIIDNNALHAARGASALVGAARIVIGLSPMTRQLWRESYKKIVKEDEIKHMVAVVDAKNNYSALGAKPKWLKKVAKFIDCKDGQEAVAILQETNISELMDSRSAMSKEYARKEIAKYITTIDEFMKLQPGTADRYECTLHGVSSKLANLDPRIANEEEKTLVMEYRRTIQAGMLEEIKFNGFYYWYEYDHQSTNRAVHKIYKEAEKAHDAPAHF